jgi:phage-related protein
MMLRPLTWVGSSKGDLKGFPDQAQDQIGFALYLAQLGLKHPAAKPLAGFGSGAMEVVSDVAGSTYRAVYLVRFRESVYVLHAFQKKSRRGISTPKAELDMIRRRLKAAEHHHHAIVCGDRRR